MTAPERETGTMLEAALLGLASTTARALPDSVVLIVPYGRSRHLRLDLPLHVAAWLRDELIAALGEPRRRPRRQVRLRRGRWLNTDRRTRA